MSFLNTTKYRILQQNTIERWTRGIDDYKYWHWNSLEYGCVDTWSQLYVSTIGYVCVKYLIPSKLMWLQ